MSADQQGGALKPVTPARVADELRKLSASGRTARSRPMSTSTGSPG